MSHTGQGNFTFLCTFIKMWILEMFKLYGWLSFVACFIFLLDSAAMHYVIFQRNQSV